MHEINVDQMNKMTTGTSSYSQVQVKKNELLHDQSVSSFLEDVENVKPNKKYVCFKEAHDFARSLKLKTRKEWRLYVKEGVKGRPQKPDYIPAHPDGIYKVKGWQGWKSWLGTADKGLL